MKTPSNGVIGLLLAGGQGRRVGGRDKGLLPWRGRPLAAWGYQALAAVTPQVFISANRSLPDYERLAPGHLLPDPSALLSSPRIVVQVTPKMCSGQKLVGVTISC